MESTKPELRWILLIIALYVYLSFFHATEAQAQVITSMAPNSGVPGKTIDVFIRGQNTHFLQGISVPDFGTGITIQKFTVANQLTGTATILVNSSSPVGIRSVTITTGQEIATGGSFEVFPATGSFKANIELLPLESISLYDLDIVHPQNTPVLFFVNLYNDAVPKNAQVFVSLYASARGYLGKMTLQGKTLTANSYTRISNRDFTNVLLNGSASNQFFNEVKVNGSFPQDNYTYKLQVLDEGGNILDEDENTTVLTNPIYHPELITPGNPFDAPPENIYVPFPLFQWFGQTNKFDFAIYRVLPNQTAEDVVRNTPVFHQQDISGNSFLYPLYAEKLIDGYTYAWQIRGKLQSPQGVQYLPSEVFWFTYTANGNASNGAVISKVQIMPQEIEVMAGKQFQFAAIVLDQDSNQVLNVTRQWQVTSGKGSIAQTGLFTAGKYPATIAALVKIGSVTDFATITIIPNPSLFEGTSQDNDILQQLFGLHKK